MNTPILPLGKLFLDNYVRSCRELVHSPKFARRHLLARFKFAALIPMEIVTTALDGIVGIVTGAGLVLSAGRSDPLAIRMQARLNRFRYMLANPYIRLIQTIKPNYAPLKKMDFDLRCIYSGDGLITNYLKNRYIDRIVTDCITEDGLLSVRKHAPFFAIACLVSRIADAILGIAAVPCGIIEVFVSSITGQHYYSIHHTAYRGLQITGVVHDLFLSLLIAINPKAFSPPPDELALFRLYHYQEKPIPHYRLFSNLRELEVLL